MRVIAIIIGFGLIALSVGVAYWFAVKEQKMTKPGPVDLDERERQAAREAASSITNINMP